MTETQISKMMTALKCTREEAIEVIKDDEAIDKGEKLFELTPEQKKAAKQATITTGNRRERSYKFTKRERKPDNIKRELILIIADAIAVDCCSFSSLLEFVTDINIIKPEREISFKVGQDTYSITLTKHRKAKDK